MAMNKPPIMSVENEFETRALLSAYGSKVYQTAGGQARAILMLDASRMLELAEFLPEPNKVPGEVDGMTKQ